MRVYLEAAELVAAIDEETEFVRLDVTGKTQHEQDAILASMKDYMAGVDCVFSRHWCRHDEGGGCERKVV